MGFQNFFVKDKSEIEENNENLGIHVAVETEEKNMPEQNAKKRYFYLALNENEEVVLNKDGQPFFSIITEEGSAPEWYKSVFRYTEKVITNDELRQEVPEFPNNIKDKKKRERIKNKIIDDAKEKLKQKAAGKIEQARKKHNGNDTAKKDDSIVLPSKQQIDKAEKVNDTSVVEPNETNNTASQDFKAEKTETEILKTSKSQNDTLNNEKVIKAVEYTAAQISKDMSEVVDDLIETIASNDKELIDNITSAIVSQGRTLDGRTKKYIEEAISIVAQKNQKVSEDVIRTVNDTSKNASESHDKIVSKVNVVGKRVGELSESIESMEGDLHRLNQLDEIAELLRNKGLNLSMEIPPISAEEADIINLVRYSQKITEQLGYAARDLIRKQEAFKSQAESNENEQNMIVKKIEDSYNRGLDDGKKTVIKQLLAKYENIDTIKDSQESQMHVIWTLLMELGVEIDGNGSYEKGKEIDLSEEDIQKMMATYSKLDGAGKYKVTRTGLSFGGEIISKAQFEKIN